MVYSKEGSVIAVETNYTMPSVSYEKLQVLVVDDFNSFRMTLNKIMHDLGFKSVRGVASGQEALDACKKDHYDLILCDYNLGRGKNGQQVLEELRSNRLLKAQDIFILLSAETSRNVVMSAYDCEPDAYLTKPITTKVIEQRLKRLLNKRTEMIDIHISLGKNNTQASIELLERKLSENPRYGMECQKLLASLYMDAGRLDDAESVYRSVLEVRALDWAQVGLSRVRIAKGEPEKAVEWLNDIIKSNPSCMKAYDALSIALEALSDNEQLQVNLEKAVEVSPMSLGRQLSLANVAMENGDAEVAAQAYRKMIKHGINSVHNSVDNQLNFVKAVTKFYDNDATRAGEMAHEAKKVLTEIEEKNDTEPDTKIKAQLLDGQLYGLQGNHKKSKEMLELVADELSSRDSIAIDIEIEVVNTLMANGNHQQAQKKIQELIDKYAGDQAALEKIDSLLYEPISEKGKRILAQANKKGINAYKAQNYDEALIPWRKGPFSVFGIDIDTEWRSDWKWQRILPHISPLTNKQVLDIGCGNGYHCLRMAGEGAARVIGIDPSPRFIVQFLMLKQYIEAKHNAFPVDVLPIGIESLPDNLGFFDTTFSMGVLYHRRSPMDHLRELKATLKPGGELVLETLIIDGELGECLVPEDRYAMMRNVWFIPSAPTLVSWLKKCGFKEARLVDTSRTSTDEQRSTEWMRFQSLPDFLDPENPERTVEGHPAPLRGTFIAKA